MRLSALAAALLLVFGSAAQSQTLDAHYEVVASVDPTDHALAAEVAIRIPAAKVQAENVFLLGGGYRVSSATAGPRARVDIVATARPMPGLQRITVRPQGPGRGDLTVRLRYAGPLGPSGTPPLNLITDELVELNLDSMWVPVREGFGSRFSLDAEIRGVPKDLVVVAPGQVTRRGDTVVIRRRTGDIDAAFAAMRGLRPVRGEGFEFYAADPEGETARLYQRHGAASLAFLERWFGPLPGRPAKVVMVRRERGSGYARPGYIVVTEGRKGAETGLGKFIAHEFAHGWWASGDPNTEDRWLSESIAEYVSLRYVEFAFGVAARDQMLEAKRKIAAAAKPVLGGGARTDAELYNKGPVLLFELEERIGRERLDRLLAQLARDPPDTTAEFMRALSEAAGAEAARAFEAAMRA